MADRQLISRAIHNLVDNAIKHTPDGGTIRLFAFYEADINAPEIVLGVADTGSGIQESMFPRLFDKFSQVPDAYGRHAGTGLGLPFCKLVVEAHKGRIWVDSTLAQGSTFYIALPINEK